MSKNPLRNALRPHRLTRAAGIRSAVWGTVFGTAGVLHFVKPEGFDRIVPEELPGTPARAIAFARVPLQLPMILSVAKLGA